MTKLTNKGPISFRIWDKAGEDKAGGLSEEDLIGAHCAIIMFEVTKKESYESVPKWYKHLRMVCEEDIPIVIVGNKVFLFLVAKGSLINLSRLIFQSERSKPEK